MTSLEQALSASVDLMQTEYYAMRLVEEAIRTPAVQWPRELSAVALSPEDAALSGSDKMDRAQELLISPEYEEPSPRSPTTWTQLWPCSPTH